MNEVWFEFNLNDFAFAFLSILLEGAPFVLLGTLISGAVDQFLPSGYLLNKLPKKGKGIFLSGIAGLVFPMCECGVVPVVRRLIRKGMPPEHGITYMLAAPIVNPITALSTFAAFKGQGPWDMTLLRLGLGFFVAVLVGFAVHHLSRRFVLTPKLAAEVEVMEGKAAKKHVEEQEQAGHEHAHAHEHAHEHAEKPSMFRRIVGALEIAASDFLDMMMYFVLGAAAAAFFNTSVRQDLILPLATDVWLATFSMMGFAALLSICSSSDAFIAATLTAFPFVSKLAFLVFGPMVDLKLIFIYSALLRKSFIALMVLFLFVLIGLICARLSYVTFLQL